MSAAEAITILRDHQAMNVGFPLPDAKIELIIATLEALEREIATLRNRLEMDSAIQLLWQEIRSDLKRAIEESK